jgi:16S rRNA U516 pseudouridylate synthase RsuA-like enzyme
MTKQNRKLTAKQKAEKARLRQEYVWVFLQGKQKRVRRPPTIEGMDVDEFIRRNADPIWLHQEGLWEYMTPVDETGSEECPF